MTAETAVAARRFMTCRVTVDITVDIDQYDTADEWEWGEVLGACPFIAHTEPVCESIPTNPEHVAMMTEGDERFPEPESRVTSIGDLVGGFGDD